MDEPVKFYFEFVSPYSYLASLRIDAAVEACGRTVDWRPIDLPRVWQSQNLLEAYLAIRKVKAPYIWRDVTRCASRAGVTMARPKSLPDTTLAKHVYWGLRDRDDSRAKPFLRAIWHRHFVAGADVATLADVAEAALPLGLDARDIETLATSPQAAARQVASNEEAVATSCFGVPWFVAGTATFFGQDRIDDLVDHLANAR